MAFPERRERPGPDHILHAQGRGCPAIFQPPGPGSLPGLWDAGQRNDTRMTQVPHSSKGLWFWGYTQNFLQEPLDLVGEAEMDPSSCFLRNLYAGQEATVRTGHGTTDWFQIGKEYVKAVYCHPAYLTYMQSTSCEMPGWVNHKLESRLPGEISITSDTQMAPPLWQKVKRN